MHDHFLTRVRFYSAGGDHDYEQQSLKSKTIFFRKHRKDSFRINITLSL